MCQGVRRILRAVLGVLLSSCVSSNFWEPACILDLLKQVAKSHFLITCCGCHIRPDSALEKAGKTEVGPFYTMSLPQGAGVMLWMERERWGSTCTHLCLLATDLQGTVGIFLGWSVILEEKRN